MLDFLTVGLVALLFLTLMEIVLGIDNIVFIAILTGRLPEEQRAGARRLGLGLALGMRVLLLLSLSWILGLTAPIFSLTQMGIPKDWFGTEVNEISVRDLILLVGGLFLIGKSVHEIHAKLEGHHEGRHVGQNVTFTGVLVQIALLDLVFSLDSVITAVGMARQIWVMIVAVVVAIGVMLIFAGPISRFVERHPTLKMLASGPTSPRATSISLWHSPWPWSSSISESAPRRRPAQSQPWKPAVRSNRISAVRRGKSVVRIHAVEVCLVFHHIRPDESGHYERRHPTR